jgi:hypothetical protein
MAYVGDIHLEQIEGGRGGAYYVCRANVQIGSMTHIAEVASNEIMELQQAIPLLQRELMSRAIAYAREALEEDEDFQSAEV